MSDVLTMEQNEQFQEDGFLLIRQHFSQEEMSGLLHYAKSDAQIQENAYSKNDGTGGKSKLSVNNELGPTPYSAIVQSRRVAGAMEQLLKDEIYHYHHKMMLKEPHVGGAWQWHQDYGYWYNNGCLFPDMASCLIAIDQASRENGCLQVIKGSHHMGRIDHGQTGDQTSADLERVACAMERMELVHCEMMPGDALFFHANLLHRSDKNTSDMPRWSLICCYNTRHNDPYFTGGRHPNYAPLDILNDDQVRHTLIKLAS
ncbi:MAG: phytanoyl-CoA dioxygenase family protein [Mariniblastus sp.]|nr:phytanoyl-CoA dioxygenase family protein [Mariniblastus sp.]